MNAPARALVVLALGILALGFGAIGLCGGYVTAISLLHSDSDSTTIWALSVPCLLGGSFMVWLCWQMIRRTLATPSREEDVHEQ